MKILHIAPNAPYNRGWGYQENLLPKYQKKLGHDVAIIVQTRTHKDGKLVDTEPEDVILEDGVRLIRLERKRYPHPVITNLRAQMDVYPILKEFRPDLVFFHGLVSSTIFQVIQYKKKEKPELVIVQDNHSDPYNSMRGDSFRDRLIRGYHRWVNRRSIPYVDKVYGVTPWRETYAREYFQIPAEKTDVLIMGADDEKVDLAHREVIRHRIRQTYGIAEDEFLVVTGGKIDEPKNIHLLMEACEKVEGVKLMIFGDTDPAFCDRFQQTLAGCPGSIHIGWVPADSVYDYFFAADLVMFPGTHSVLWEQACASKTPCVFARWDGMDHLDNGGNSEFFDCLTLAGIREKLEQLYFTQRYQKLRQVAMSEATDIFLYGNIAVKSLEQADRAEK